MFARSPRSAYICRSCRHRLRFANGSSQWQNPITPLSHAPRLGRHYATALARVEDEDDIRDGRTGPAPSEEAADTEAAEKDPSQARRYSNRVWRPTTVTNLGFTALGKPTEIILLEPRDRRFPLVPQAEVRKTGERIQETLDSENRSVLPEQLKENIERIWTRAQEHGRPLDDDELMELKEEIARSFRQKQLLSYIEQTGNGLPKNLQINHSKLRLARFIVRHIWGLQSPGQPPIGESPAFRARMNIQAGLLKLLLANADQPLKSISEELGVQVDVFKQKGMVQVSGPEAAVNRAKKTLANIRSEYVSAKLVLEDGIWDRLKLHPGPLLDSFLRSLEQKLGVSVELNLKQSSARIVYHKTKPETPAWTRREFLLVAADTPTPPFHVWPAHAAGHSTLAPCTCTETTNPFTKPKRWGRVYQIDDRAATETDVREMSPLSRQMFKLDYHTIRDVLGAPALQNAAKHVPMREEYAAYFGQALFDFSKKNMDFVAPLPPSPSSAKNLTSRFSMNIPLLPQFLALRTPRPPERPDTAANIAGTLSPRPFVVKIVLVPAASDQPSSPLEVYLQGEDVRHGLAQPLQVQSISAVLTTQRYFLLLPTLVVDVNFVRQVKHDIFARGLKPRKENGVLLRQLATYLNQAQGQTDPNFSPFVKLSIPAGLLSATMAAEISGESKQATASQVATPDLPSPTKDAVVEYMLSTADTVDVASYSPPFTSSLSLDHIFYTGLQRGRVREALRLAEQPLLAPSSSKKVKFGSLFQSACDIAAALGDVRLMVQ